jgi:hypothetical protein
MDREALHFLCSDAGWSLHSDVQVGSITLCLIIVVEFGDHAQLSVLRYSQFRVWWGL